MYLITCTCDSNGNLKETPSVVDRAATRDEAQREIDRRCRETHEGNPGPGCYGIHDETVLPNAGTWQV